MAALLNNTIVEISQDGCHRVCRSIECLGCKGARRSSYAVPRCAAQTEPYGMCFVHKDVVDCVEIGENALGALRRAGFLAL